MTNQITTGTFDESGLVRLPSILQNRTIKVGDYLVREEWWDYDDVQIDDVRRGCKALGVETESDEDGLCCLSLGKEEEWYDDDEEVA